MSKNKVPVSVFCGDRLTVSVFGTSHGKEIGVSVKGFPKNYKIDSEYLSAFMKRRSASNRESLKCLKMLPERARKIFWASF